MRTGSRHQHAWLDTGSGGCLGAGLNFGLRALVFSCLLLMLLFGALGLGRLFDPDEVVYRLGRPVSEAEARRGVRRGAFTAQGRGGAYPSDTRSLAPALCEVTHEHYVSGKNGGWRRDFTSAYAADGVTLDADPQRLSVDFVGARWAFEPTRWRLDPSFRALFPAMPPGGRVRSQCAYQGERVFVEACLRDPTTLSQCADRVSTITLAPTSQPRRARQASEIGYQLACLFVALAGLAFWLARALRPGAWFDTLSTLSGSPDPAPARRRLMLAGLVVLLATVALTVLETFVRESLQGVPWAGLVMVTGGGALSAVALALALHQLRFMRGLIAFVDSVSAIRFDRPEPGVAGVSLRVAPDAPVVDGGALGPSKPLLGVEIDVFVAQHRSVRRVRYGAFLSASWLPVSDGYGNGVLTLARASLDLRAKVWRFVSGGGEGFMSALRASVAQVAAPKGVPYEVEVSYLDRGEALYVIGQATVVEDLGGQSDYRAIGRRAELGREGPVVVHAGTRESFRGRLVAWCALLIAAATAASALTLLGVGAAGWLYHHSSG
ncbi:MAG: hypothetical protein JNK72_07660 [Myxococcales bacterium]|nr:hypothetical protein [Myxococcales bacterium]